MKLFVWNSNFCMDYSSGMGVAVAETVDEARGVLLKEAAERGSHYVEWVGAGCSGEPDRVVDLPGAAFVTGGG